MMSKEMARSQMVRQQVRTRYVFDQNVLELMQTLPRDQFVSKQYEDLAYADVQLPLAHSQVMMTPGMEGCLLQSLELESTDRVLEVGTGSGFLTACLASLSASVVSIDIFDDLLATAATNLERVELENVTLENMDATVMLPDGPFDAIAVTGSVPSIDTRFVDLLSPGGRLYLIVGAPPMMEAFLIVRGQNSEWYGNSMFETEIPALISERQDMGFTF